MNKSLRQRECPAESAAERYDLEQAIGDYLLWMSSVKYSARTIEGYRQQLTQLLLFIKRRRLSWDKIFTLDTLKEFQKVTTLPHTHALRGLGRYLFEHGKIPRPIPRYKAPVSLPDIYEQHLADHRQGRGASDKKIMAVRRVLASFHHYLKGHKINLRHLTIGHLDGFLAEFNAGFSQTTRGIYRSYLRGFLRYLYRERKIIRTDLAPLVVGAPVFAKAKPPKFLRPKEVEKLFASLTLDSASDIRTYAIVHLAYYLGLRPAEISKITLDDISFGKAELTVGDRKSNNPIKLPLAEQTIKAIAAYMIGARPDSKQRALFLRLYPPHGALSPGTIVCHIRACMKRAGLCSTAYWLRHTYAQNLLEAGASMYEIKEMLGHDTVESTRKYFSIHINLMRKVLFDEQL